MNPCLTRTSLRFLLSTYLQITANVHRGQIKGWGGYKWNIEIVSPPGDLAQITVDMTGLAGRPFIIHSKTTAHGTTKYASDRYGSVQVS